MSTSIHPPPSLPAAPILLAASWRFGCILQREWMDISGLMAGAMVSASKSQLALDEIRHGVAGALSILKNWSLSDQQILAILGAGHIEDLRNWVSGQARQYPSDLPHRLGFVGGIQSRLRQLYPNRQGADQWLSMPNPTLGDKRPIDVMTGGNLVGLMLVRDHLRNISPRR